MGHDRLFSEETLEYAEREFSCYRVNKMRIRWFQGDLRESGKQQVTSSRLNKIVIRTGQRKGATPILSIEKALRAS